MIIVLYWLMVEREVPQHRVIQGNVIRKEQIIFALVLILVLFLFGVKKVVEELLVVQPRGTQIIIVVIVVEIVLVNHGRVVYLDVEDLLDFLAPTQEVHEVLRVVLINMIEMILVVVLCLVLGGHLMYIDVEMQMSED